MAAKCAAITLGGSPCKGLVRPGNEYCPAHDPARQEARRRAASKAGKSKPGRELVLLKTRLEDLAEEVLSGKVDRADAVVVAQIFNTVIRAVSVELKLRETEELTRELEELQQAVARQQGAKTYGA